MQIVSIQVGRPRVVRAGSREVTTAIFKERVAGPVFIRTLNIEGDEQADLTVHGGADKAAYAYPAEHYPYWREQLNEEVAFGSFGENLTTTGLLEDELCIGDTLKVGEVELVVTQPRLPCYKLAVRFGRADMVKRFLRSLRSGFYLRVLREGIIAPGDDITIVGRNEQRVSVRDLVSVYATQSADADLMRRALRIEALPQGWREEFEERLRTGA